MTTPKQHALMDEAIVSASFAGAQSVEEILDGIDKDECEYDKGWWETSYGAEFGARKKKEILEAFEARFEEGVKAERERVREWAEYYGVYTEGNLREMGRNDACRQLLKNLSDDK